MTLADFRILLTGALRNDVDAPVDNELLPYIALSGKEISSAIHPLELIEVDDESFSVDFWLDSTFFVRQFVAPDGSSENDSIGFDDKNLCYALVYKTAINIGTERDAQIRNEQRMFSFLVDYEFNMFDESHETIADRLKAQGFYKPYKIDKTITSDSRYIYEEGFLVALGDYLLDKTQEMDPSYRRYINDFMKFQDGQISRSDLQALDEIMVQRISNG